MHIKIFTPLRSESGQAILMALTAVGLLALMAGASATIAGLMATAAQREGQREVLNDFIQSLETVVSNPQACSGVSVGPASNQTNGLTFGGSKICDSTCMAAASSANGVAVSLATHHLNAAGQKITAAAGAIFPNHDLQVDQLYIRNAAATDSPNSYSGELVVQARALNPVNQFAPRVVANVSWIMNPTTNTMTSCQGSTSPQALCEMMNCRYNAEATQKCSCGLPDVDCSPPGTSPQAYVHKFNPTTLEVECKTITLRCSDGLFMAGIQTDGSPLCLAAEGYVGATPTPSATPTPTATPVGPTPTPTATATPNPGMCDNGEAPLEVVFASQNQCESQGVSACNDPSAPFDKCIQNNGWRPCCAPAPVASCMVIGYPAVWEVGSIQCYSDVGPPNVPTDGTEVTYDAHRCKETSGGMMGSWLSQCTGHQTLKCINGNATVISESCQGM